MNMPGNLFAIAFRQQRLGLLFSIIMFIMVYVGCLAMASQAILARTSLTWGNNLENRITIEASTQVGEVADMRRSKEEAIKTKLQTVPEVVNVTTVSPQDTARLIEPWISDETLLASLPLPLLIDVDLKKGHNLNLPELESSLSQVVNGVRIHLHAAWMDKLMGFLDGLGYLALVMLALTGIAIVASIAVICRAALSIQHETIELLHYMGGSDLAIARQFQCHIRKLAVPVSGAAFGAAVVTLIGLVFLLHSLGGSSLVSATSWMTVGVVMAIVPFCAVGLAVLTSRVSVIKLLGRLP